MTNIDTTTQAQLRAEVDRLREYAFGMETALRGARASGTASEAALWAAECAELRMTNSRLRERIAEPEADCRPRDCDPMQAPRKDLALTT